MLKKLILLGGFVFLALQSQGSTLRTHVLTGEDGMTQEELQFLAQDIPNFYRQLRECEVDIQNRFANVRLLNKLTYSDSRNGIRTFKVEASGSYPAPSFRPYSVSLVVTQKLVKETKPVASDKPSQWETKCKLSLTDGE